MRRVLLAPVACAAVVVGVLVFGGQDDPGPAPDAADPVSHADFCAGFGRLVQARSAVLQAPAPAAVEDLRTAARDVGDLARAADLPTDAREGAAYVADALVALPDAAGPDDVVAVDDIASEAGRADAEALSAFIGETCNTGAPPG